MIQYLNNTIFKYLGLCMTWICFCIPWIWPSSVNWKSCCGRRFTITAKYCSLWHLHKPTQEFWHMGVCLRKFIILPHFILFWLSSYVTVWLFLLKTRPYDFEWNTSPWIFALLKIWHHPKDSSPVTSMIAFSTCCATFISEKAPSKCTPSSSFVDLEK